MSVRFQYQGFDVLSQWDEALTGSASAQAYDDIAGVGSNAIGITTKLYVDTGTSTQLVTNGIKTTPDANLIAGIKQSEAKGLKVLLEPAIMGKDGTASFQLQPSNTSAFFASYKAAMVHLATVAQQTGVDTLSIGNEMGTLSGSAYRSEWLDMIAAIRKVYSGKLTYKAASNEASSVSFWDKLDTIGINAYLPLTASYNASVSELEKAWTTVPTTDYWSKALNGKSMIDFMHSLSTTYGKQVLITEVGYRSVLGTAIHPSQGPDTISADETSQANAYQALFQVAQAHGGSWFSGLMLWEYYLGDTDPATDFSPMDKSAEALVDKYFGGSGTVTGLNEKGSASADLIDVGAGYDHISTGLGNDIIRAGSGNDVIVAGPSSINALKTTTMVISGYGAQGSNGANAQVEVLVNGKKVGATMTFSPADDPAGYQTYTLTFTNPAQMRTLDIALLNPSSGAAAKLREVTINGVKVNPADTTNASAPGTFQLYNQPIHLNATAHPSWFYGATTDTDRITGGAGNDTIDGGAGTDTAIYRGTYSQYSLSRSGNKLAVADRVAGRDGVDSLTNVEYLQFSDRTVAVASLLLPEAGTSTVAGLLAPLVISTSIASDETSGAAVIRAAVSTTAAPSIRLSGVSVAGGSVSVYNGSAKLTSVDTDSSGHYSVTLEDVPDGVYKLSLKASRGNLSSANSEVQTVIVGAASKIANLITSTSATPKAFYVTDPRNPITVSLGKLAAITPGLRQAYTDYWIKVSDTASNVLSSLSSLRTQSHLGGIALTDTHVFQVSDQTMKQMLDDDRDVLGKIYGGYSFSVRTTSTSGTVTTKAYDANGALTSSTSVKKDGTNTETYVSYADGTTKDTITDAKGHLVSVSKTDAAGTHFTQYGITGKPYSSQTIDSSKSGALLDIIKYNTDGSRTTEFHASGVTLSFTNGADEILAYGGDTMKLPTTAFHDTIQNFHGGSGSGHDTVVLSKSLASSFGELDISRSGSVTKVAIDSKHSIDFTQLNGSLTASDFKFV